MGYCSVSRRRSSTTCAIWRRCRGSSRSSCWASSSWGCRGCMRAIAQHLDLPQLPSRRRNEGGHGAPAGWTDALFEVAQFLELGGKRRVGRDIETDFAHQEVAFGARAQLERKLKEAEHVADNLGGEGCFERPQI